MPVEVRLVEGPADGTDLVISGDPMNPPETYQIMHASNGHGVRKLVYRREVNPGNEGPLWFYRYDGEGVQRQPVRRMIIASSVRVARLFMRESEFDPAECKVAVRFEDMQGCQLDTWEVWFLQRAWPSRTHEDVRRMEEMVAYARHRGADIRRWWT
jgi:hypothetical protein